MKGVLNFFRVFITVLLCILLVIYLIPYGLFYSVKAYVTPEKLEKEINKLVDSTLNDLESGNTNDLTEGVLSYLEGMGLSAEDAEAFLNEDDVKEFLNDTISAVLEATLNGESEIDLPPIEDFSEILFNHKEVILPLFGVTEEEISYVEREDIDNIASNLYDVLKDTISEINAPQETSTDVERETYSLSGNDESAPFYNILKSLDKCIPMNAEDYPTNGNIVSIITFVLGYRPMLNLINGILIVLLLLVVVINIKRCRFLMPIAISTIIPSLIFILLIALSGGMLSEIIGDYSSLVNGYKGSLLLIIIIYLAIAILCIVLSVILKKRKNKDSEKSEEVVSEETLSVAQEEIPEIVKEEVPETIE